jgi:hypothetical protein
MDSCENRHGIIYEEIAEKLLFHRWRKNIDGTIKVVFLNYYFCMFSAIEYSNDSLVEFCEQSRLRLNYTGQHLALEELLNDTYDNILRRIFITEVNNSQIDGHNVALNNVFNPFSTVNIGLNNEINDLPTDVGLNSELADSESILFVSFIINIPIDILVTDELISALVAVYAIAGKQWIIERF